MIVANWMSKNIITVDENDSMHGAMKLLKEHDIRMLPVMKKGKLVGILTDRDLKRASASDATSLEIHELFYLLQNLKQELEAKAALLYMIDHAGNNREIFAEKII